MNASPRAFDVQRHGPALVIRFMHENPDRLDVEMMNYEIHALLEEMVGAPKFVVDFHNVQRVSSAVLGVLMGINLKVCRRRGEMRLCCLSRELLEVFVLMRLDTILNIDPTLNESLARIGG